MSAIPIIIGVLALMICSSSSAAMLMMGGDEDKPPASPGPSPPTVPYIIADESHLSEYKAGTVELGAGNSVEDCRKLAYDADYAAFGFRKAAKNCWAIIDGEAAAGKVVPLVDHTVGCVTRGEDINNGCKTTKTNVIRTRHYSGVTSFEDIACNSIDSCRAAAKAKGAKSLWMERSWWKWLGCHSSSNQ